MGEKSNPFSVFDQLTEARAALDAGKKSTDASGVGVDRHQLTQDAKRREAAKAKGIQLGAKPRPRSRPNSSRVIRGSMENPGAE